MNNYLFNKKINLVFIDWHGVLGNRGFWCDQSKKDDDLSKFCNYLFSNTELVEDWMRNKLDRQVSHSSFRKI